MKKTLFKIALILFVTGVSYLTCNDLFIFAEPRSTSNLRAYERNLDILADKSGSLHQLIEELQRPYIKTATGAVSNLNTTAKIIVPGLSTDDTISHVVVYSSANLVLASSITVQQTALSGETAPIIKLTSRLWGVQGNSVTFNFSQINSTSIMGVQMGQSIITSTATVSLTQFEFKLATGTNSVYFSSANSVCASINSNHLTRGVVDCFVVSGGTNTFIPFATTVALNGGLGGPHVNKYVLPGSLFTVTSTGTVTASTGTIIRPSDGLELYGFDRPDGN